MFDLPAVPQRVDRRDDCERENRRGDHAADDRGRDSFHYISAGSLGPQDREQAGDSGDYRHHLGPDSLDRALNDGLVEI